jgi:tetratricopeptide (TPR) repeat protein
MSLRRTAFLLAASIPLLVGGEDPVREARARIQAGDYRAAAIVLERGMLADPNSDAIESVYLSLPAGILAARLAERFERAQGTTDVNELIALGRVLSDLDPHRKTESPKLAIELLKKAIRLAPDNSSAYYNYGRALRTVAAPAGMFAAWEKALSLHPDAELAIQIHTRIARQRVAMGEADAAGRAFHAAHEINRKRSPGSARWAWEYFRFLRAQSLTEEAQKLLDEILAWDPRFVPAVLERARLSVTREEWPEGIEDAEYVLRYAEGNAEIERGAHALLARSYHAVNQPRKARLHEAWIEARPK